MTLYLSQTIKQNMDAIKEHRFTIRKVDKATKNYIKRLAKDNNRSINAQLLEILKKVTKGELQ